MTELLKRYPRLLECGEEIRQALEMLIDTYKEGGKVLLCGNGGSSADCEHIVGELMKGFLAKREVTDARIPEDLRSSLQGALPPLLDGQASFADLQGLGVSQLPGPSLSRLPPSQAVL